MLDTPVEFEGIRAAHAAVRDAVERVDLEGFAKDDRRQLIDRGAPRHAYEIRSQEGDASGAVTSGTMGSMLGEPIALGYGPSGWGDPDTTERVVVRDEPKKARSGATRFLDR